MAAFRDILGHAREVGVLKNSLKNRRFSHSFLFSGPDGVGKRLAALAFAASLNCADPAGDDSCGRCADCALMDASTHPNLIRVSPVDKNDEPDVNGLIKIERVREVQSALRYRVERGMKVVVIDGADRMQPAAANAFLKTLEEPPAASVIILVTSRASELLPTIISRCHRMNFRPIPAEELGRALEEESGLTREDALALARLSCGSMGAALRQVNEGAYEKRREVLERLGGLGRGDVEGALRLAAELYKRDDLGELLEFMKIWYRDRVVAAEGAPGLVVNADFSEFMEDAAELPFFRLADSYSMIEETRTSIMPPRYGNRQLAMEALFLRLAGC
ncbi:MAG: DNA polymerase III subunit delta' [Thermodesulfobacteriota bacterium]